MTFRLPTGSGVGRAIECPGSTALPRVERTSGAPAERGDAAHTFIAAAKEVGREKALELVHKRWRPYCESIPLEKLNLDSFRPEVAFAYNPITRTSRILGQNIQRRYVEHGGDPSTEIFVTPDGIGLTEDAVYVVDWKSGFAQVASPEDSWQMKTGSVAVATYFQRRIALADVTRLREGGKKPWVESYVFDGIALDDAADQMAAAMPSWQEAYEQVQRGERPRIVAGEHCGYCQCVADCPATSGLIQRFAAIAYGNEQPPAVGDLTPWIVSRLTPDRARQTRELLVQLKSVTAQVENALKDYSTAQPFPMGGGKVYGPRSVEKEALDPSVVWAVLKFHGGEELAKLAVSMEATKTGLKEAARELAATKGGRISTWEERLLQEVRDRGGSIVTPGTRFEEHTPRTEEG